MKLSESWLREWVDPGLDSEALAHRLTMLGLEVDEVIPAAESIDNIVVGEVLEIAAHPDADKLSLCSVDIGESSPLAIVCGASNVRVGGRYPTAVVGARLPGGIKIKRAKIRGQVSEGMLCSTAELGLAENADGIMALDPDAVVGTPIGIALDLDDRIIDIDLTPNRADCFSVLGVARDIAAGQRIAFSEPDVAAVAPTIKDVIPVNIDDGAGCGRFVGRVVRGIEPDATIPVWMQERLRRCGIRPIHPVVDVTNYVMLEFGQPMHAYDLSRLTGSIDVRRGKDEEQLTLLDGQSVTVDPEVLVIADDSGAIGLAGIMGGQATGVSDDTQDVFLESAFFAPAAIAGRARRFGMHTDASMRFERGVDSAHQVRAIERATRLLLDITGGSPGPCIEVTGAEQLPDRQPIKLRKDRLSAVLGLVVPDPDVESLLAGLQMHVAAEAGGWLVTAPTARFDIEIEADLIEEIARLYGYDRIDEIPGTSVAALGHVTESRVPEKRVREALAARGYQEVVTYSFVAPDRDELFSCQRDRIGLSNPISSEMAVMRQSLWPGLVGGFAT